MPRTKTRIIGKRITRGARKGQTIKVYASSGTEVRQVKQGSGRGSLQTAMGHGKVKASPGKFQGVQGLPSKTNARKGAPDTQASRAAAGQKYAKKATTKPSLTTNHTAAGLHRIGKSGNRYTDKAGTVFHRGKGGLLQKGEPKSSKGKTKVVTSKGATSGVAQGKQSFGAVKQGGSNVAKSKKKAAAGRKGGKSRPSLKKGKSKKGSVPPAFLKNKKKKKGK